MPPFERRPAGMSSEWPVQGPQSYENRFGRGYKIIFWISFVTCVSLIVSMGTASTGLSTFRRIGLLLMAFGGSSLAVLVYQAVVVKAFARVGRGASGMETRITTPQSNPKSYWLTLIMGLLVSLVFVIAGVWVLLHAAFLASKSHGSPSP